MIKRVVIIMLALGIFGCNSDTKSPSNQTYQDIQITGAMKNVMWKGELGGTIHLDTLSNKKGLYAIGPESYLTGELLVNNGESYVARVTSDSTMTVKKTFDVSAPFLVYGTINEWTKVEIGSEVKTITDIEKLVSEKTADFKRPFAFKLLGKVAKAKIHIQNLPKGAIVTSPAEAHQGQIDYVLLNEDVTIIGFFSTEHKGIFTHHDSTIHLHLITKDESKMGHLDALEIDNMQLYLPKS